jgi:hypothetical protein
METALSPSPLALARARPTESEEQLVARPGAQLNRAMVPALESAAGLRVSSERFAPRPRQANSEKQGLIDLASGIGQIWAQRPPRSMPPRRIRLIALVASK